jgi:Tfp pilus assembly protein PilF
VSDLRSERIVVLLLLLVTYAVYWQAIGHPFVEFDDGQYVFENERVQAGLTRDGVAWAFTTTFVANWHPLTWLSHMLDCQLYGLNPGGHHLTSILFHIANTALLFLVLKRTTGAQWRSLFVAALFAIHPLHVESVVWVSERKDVLSGFFWMLTLWAYVRYAERPSSLGSYLLVLLCLGLGLMAKPMLVTLPFVLLLLDFWPLGRFRDGRSERLIDWSRARRLILEKLPLFVMAGVSSVATLLIQRASGATTDLEVLPFDLQIGNSLLAYMGYIGKTIWPVGLGVFYPHPREAVSPLMVMVAAVFLITVCVLVIRTARTHPYLAVGWLWYMGTLVPVIGLVQVGGQSMADRYTYLPLIGLFIIAAWGLPELVERFSHRRVLLSAVATPLLVVFAVLAWFQVTRWKDSVSLFEHTVRVTSDNYRIHYNLGVVLERRGELDDAIMHYSEAIRIRPHYVSANFNLGNALAKQGKLDHAFARLSEAVRLKPDLREARLNLGATLARQGKLDEAIAQYAEILQLHPDFSEARVNLGASLAVQGRREEAIAHFSEVLRVEPDHPRARLLLQATRSQQASPGG